MITAPITTASSSTPFSHSFNFNPTTTTTTTVTTTVPLRASTLIPSVFSQTSSNTLSTNIFTAPITTGSISTLPPQIFNCNLDSFSTTTTSAPATATSSSMPSSLVLFEMQTAAASSSSHNPNGDELNRLTVSNEQKSNSQPNLLNQGKKGIDRYFPLLKNNSNIFKPKLTQMDVNNKLPIQKNEQQKSNLTPKRKRSSPNSKIGQGQNKQFKPITNSTDTEIKIDENSTNPSNLIKTNTKDLNADTKKNSKPARPPPIFVRDEVTADIIKTIKSVIANNNFKVTNLLKGSITEIKIQTFSPDDFRNVTKVLDGQKVTYYTHRLNSDRGITVVLKGIEKGVNTEEIKTALSENGFKVQLIYNMKNRNKELQPLYKIELEPSRDRLKNNEKVHPIYNLRYLLHRVVKVEEPHKRTGPVQCSNCQEYNHTKSYCKLPVVCVICGDRHDSSKCPKPKTDPTCKKCSNCGDNHTANFRDCPVYKALKSSSLPPKKPSIRKEEQTSTTLPAVPIPPLHGTYANTVIEGVPEVKSTKTLDETIANFMQLMLQIFSSMQQTLQELVRNQNLLIQHIECRTQLS